MKRLLFFIVLTAMGMGQGLSQSLIQTYTDRCTGETKVFTVAMNGATVVTFYNKSRTFTSQQFQNGELQVWLEQTYLWWSTISPCSTATTGATATTNTTQQTTSNATTAATNATANTGSTATAATGNTGATGSTTNNTNTSTNASSSGTGGTDSTSTNQTNTSGNETSNTGSTDTGSTDTGSTESTNTGSTDTGSTESSTETNSGGTAESTDTGGGDSSAGDTGDTSNDTSGGESTGESGGGEDTGDSSSGGSEDQSGSDSSDSDNSSSDSDNSSGDGDSSDDSSSGESEGDSTEESGESNEESSTEESTDESSDESSEETTEEEVDESSEESSEEESSEEESSEEETTEEESEEEKQDEESEESDEESEEDTEEESDEEESDDEESEDDEEEDSEEEGDNEDEEEDNKNKKKKRKLAPPVVMANVLNQQLPTGEYSRAAMFGVSQSSLMGNETFGLNLMVYDNLQQFMLNANYSRVHIKTPDVTSVVHMDHKHSKEGKKATIRDSINPPQPRVNRVYSGSIGVMKMFTTYMTMMNHSMVWLGKKGSATGLALGLSSTALEMNVTGGNVFYDDVVLGASMTGFWTKPFAYSPRLTIAPMVAVSSPFLSYSVFGTDKAFWNSDLMFIGGPNITYRLTQRFGLNLGVTVIESTIQDFPTLKNFMIGGRFAF